MLPARTRRPSRSAAPLQFSLISIQNIAGTDEKMLTVACLEIERPAQRYDQLHRCRIVPSERAAGSRLLKGDRLHRGLAALQITALTGSRSMAPSSKCEFPSSPVHIRTLRSLCPLLLHLPVFRAASSVPDYRGIGPAGKGNDRFPTTTDAARADRRAVPRVCPRSPLCCGGGGETKLEPTAARLPS